MHTEPNAVLIYPAAAHAGWRAWHETVRLHVSFTLLGVMCLGYSLLAIPLRLLLPRAFGKRIGRRCISVIFRAYLRFQKACGRGRVRVTTRDSAENCHRVYCSG